MTAVYWGDPYSAMGAMVEDDLDKNEGGINPNYSKYGHIALMAIMALIDS